MPAYNQNKIRKIQNNTKPPIKILSLEDAKKLAEYDGLKKDAERYRYLRSVDINHIKIEQIFCGSNSETLAFNKEDLDNEIDSLIKSQFNRGEKKQRHL